MADEARVRALVRQVVYRAIGRPVTVDTVGGRALVTGQDVEAAPLGGEVVIPVGALVTPLARQAAMERRVSLVERSPAAPPVRPRSASEEGHDRTVAVGADHGGFELKNTVTKHLRALGYAVTDLGTNSSAPVDYPDVAEAVARQVAGGDAWRGIVVDGAGVGSCMAANKVPGIRAAACYDQATAINSRAHNDSNVLTLGSGIISRDTALAIVGVWLETPAEGGRHARRVGKIMDIERRSSGGTTKAPAVGRAPGPIRHAV